MKRFAELEALDQASWILIDGEIKFTNLVARRVYPQLSIANINHLGTIAGETWSRISEVSPANQPNIEATQARTASWGDCGHMLLQLRQTAADAGMLTKLLDALPQRIASLDENNRLMWVNTPLADKFNFRRESMVGMTLQNFLPRRTAQELDQAAAKARSSCSTSRYYSNGLAAKKPAEREFMSEVMPLDNDNADQLLIICTDVSPQQPIRSQAESRTAILERIARADPISIVLTELVQHVRVYSNATSTAILLAKPDDSADQPERGRFTVVASNGLPAFVQNALEGLPVALESGPCGSSAIYGRRNLVDDIPTIDTMQPIAGKLRQANINACWSEPISSPNGLVVGSLVIYHKNMVDEAQYREMISGAALAAGIAIERGEAENRLVTINAELEQRVAERTQALTQSLHDIERARNEAESATQAKSRFLAAASHDLRQPLQALSLYLTALQSTPPHTQLVEITGKIGNAVSAMNDTLASLLDITSISSGKINAKPQTFPIASTLARLKAVHEPRAEAAGLAFHVDNIECGIITDEALFYRILDNLLTNAISYTEQGTVHLRCVIDKSQVRIEVSDTGVGIASDQHERIFEEYVQLRNPGRTRKMGMGLGLAVVAQLCKLLGHELQVTSEPGVGSTFSISANRSIHTTIAATTPPETTPAATVKTANPGPCVIFVDDDEDIIDAMSMVMTTRDINLLTCYCADEAISLFENGIVPDLLITDLRLPDMTGGQLIQKARHAFGSQLPAILITGYADSMEFTGNKDDIVLLKKPVSTDILLELVQKMISKPDPE